eukprot:scaffold199789_cov45-Attheya_sp.AAC.1
MVICLWYDGMWWWRGKWENGLNARMVCSGDSGGGDFLARILVYKGEEGRLSDTGWIIVEKIGGFWTLRDMLAFLRALGWTHWWV